MKVKTIVVALGLTVGGMAAAEAATVGLSLVGAVDGSGNVPRNVVTVASGFNGALVLNVRYQVSEDINDFLAVYYSITSSSSNAFTFCALSATDTNTVHFGGPFTESDCVSAKLPAAGDFVASDNLSITMVASDGYDASLFTTTGGESFRINTVTGLLPGSYVFSLAESLNDGLGWDRLSNEGDTLSFDSIGDFTLVVAAVPEPASLALLALASVAVLYRRRV